MSQMVTVWITKYALTSGIQRLEAEYCSDSSPEMIRTKRSFGVKHFHHKGTEYHLSEDAAMLHAEVMRKKKIESLKKQIKKLENLKFKIHKS